MKRAFLLAAPCLLLLLGTTPSKEPVKPADEKPAYTAKQFEADKKLVEKVGQALLAQMEPVPGYKWPPVIQLIESTTVNCWAHAVQNEKDETVKAQPYVTLTTAWMRDIVKGDSDVLAYVMGHELGHIHHRHVVVLNPGATDFSRITFQRKRELEADDFGAQLLLKAGYSLKKALTGQYRIEAYNKRHESTVDELSSTHPSWLNRFKLMEKDQRLWHAMSAFANGVTFLNSEQFSLAASCFERVTKEFPQCYEAWVNHGYANLMMYCDGLTAEDLKLYGVGQVLCGGFYQRAKSLTPTVRGRNEKLWYAAVGSLNQALLLKPDLALAKANLALAYLFHPAGSDVEKAAELLAAANEAVAADKTLDPITRATVLVNLGTVQMVSGTRKDGLRKFDEAIALTKDLGNGEASLLRGAVLFNQALARATATDKLERQEALTMFAHYLKSTDPNSAWWPVAFDRYAELCKAGGKDPENRESLQRDYTAKVRAPAAVELEGGLKVTLGEPIEDVLERLGPAKETRILGPGLKRLVFEKYALELIATDQVVAIVLTSPKAPVLALRSQGPGSKVAFELKVGLSYLDVRKKMPDGENYVSRELLVPEVNYHYYRQFGIAIRYDDHPRGSIKELILVRIPDPPSK